MDSAVVTKWVIALPLLGLGAWIVFFNVYRYRLIRANKRAGIKQHVSSVGLMGPLFLLAGLAVAPIEFHFWFFAVVLLEIAAVNFSVEVEQPEAEKLGQNDLKEPTKSTKET